MPKGQKHHVRVMAGATEIVRRLRRTKATISSLMRDYECGYQIIMRAVLSQITHDQYGAIVRRKRVQGGKRGGFKPGHVTWNVGMKGWCPPGCRATQFRPGHMRGASARKYRPVGSISVRADRDNATGKKPRRPRYSRFIKVKDDGRPQDRWIPLARYLWEKAHGRVPAGMFVGHRNNDTMDDGPCNLILVDRREHMRRLYARPEVIAKCRARAGAVTKRRHAQNRAAKKWTQGQKRQSRIVWECVECGAEVAAGTVQCPKCGSNSITQTRIQPMPESMVRAAMELQEVGT